VLPLLLLLLKLRKLLLQAAQLAVVAVGPDLQDTVRRLQVGDLHGGLTALIQRCLQLRSSVLPTQPSPLQEGVHFVHLLLRCVELRPHAVNAAAEALCSCTGCHDCTSSSGVLLKPWHGLQLPELLQDLTLLLVHLFHLLLKGQGVTLDSECGLANNQECLSHLGRRGLHLTLLALAQPIQHVPERT
jgi:hypothetical protein